MDEYIERGEATRAAVNAFWKTMSVGKISKAINDIPAADVAPVVHGRWIPYGWKWCCSKCDMMLPIDGTPAENNLRYCPNCGARMEDDG